MGRKVRLRFWHYTDVFFWIFLLESLVTCDVISSSTKSDDVNLSDEKVISKDSRGLFSPRMDYDQWTPLGHGDPLKNDPTYDYVPPVLERVHYWVDPALRKPDPPLRNETQKTEILVLGVSSKKPSTVVNPSSAQAESRRDSYDPFMKFIDGPKFNNYHNNHHASQKQQYPIPASYYPSPFYTAKIKFDDEYKNEQRAPYTMLMPPPISASSDDYASAYNDTTLTAPMTAPLTTTESTVSIAAANLIYQSSSASNPEEWKDTRTQFAIVAEPSSQISWRTPTPAPIIVYEVSSKNETKYNNVYTPSVKNSPITPGTFISPLAPSTHVNDMQVLHIAGDRPTVAHVSVGGVPMHKGHVTDDIMDIESTYVNIGKINAQVQTSPDISPIRLGPIREKPATLSEIDHIIIRKKPSSVHTTSNISPMFLGPIKEKPFFSTIPQISTKPPQTGSNYPSMLQELPSMFNKPIKTHTATFSSGSVQMPTMDIETMQTMLPPPVTDSKIRPSSPSALFNVLLRETRPPMMMTTVTTSTTTPPTTTTPPPPTTTTSSSLTTDPLFSHYKQPAAPLRGPMYLIIQGHSKVKTYGPKKENILGLPVPELNEISQTDDESRPQYMVKHLHNQIKEDLIEDQASIRSDKVSKDLQSLQHVLDTGLGALDITTLSSPRRKRDFDIKETEVGSKFNVGEGQYTSEQYRKGIVETDTDIKFKNTKRRNKKQLQVEELFPINGEVAQQIANIFETEGSGLGALADVL